MSLFGPEYCDHSLCASRQCSFSGERKRFLQQKITLYEHNKLGMPVRSLKVTFKVTQIREVLHYIE